METVALPLVPRNIECNFKMHLRNIRGSYDSRFRLRILESQNEENEVQLQQNRKRLQMYTRLATTHHVPCLFQRPRKEKHDFFASY